MDTAAFQSKTLSLADLNDPAIAPTAAALLRFAVRLGAQNTPFAVNGILKRRLWIRRHKLWEYARAVAAVIHKRDSRRGAQVPHTPAAVASGEVKERRKFRVLDFGGAATIPIFYLAAQECEVWCLDLDESLTLWTNRTARKRGWRLRGLTHDLTRVPAPADWGQFDAVISCSVLEHIHKPLQPVVVERLSGLLKPGGVFLFSFDYGKDAPVENAVRSESEVGSLVQAAGLSSLSGAPFHDTGERFALDKRHPRKKFTFASLFLKKDR